MAMAVILFFAPFQNSQAQTPNVSDVTEMCAKLDKLIPAIEKASTVDEVTLLTTQFDKMTKDYEKSTESLTPMSRKKLAATYLGIIKEMTRASMRFQGLNPDTPSMKQKMEQGMSTINEFVRNTADQSATLGDFLTTLDQM